MAGKASGLQTLQDAGDLRGLPNGVHRNRALSLQESTVRFPGADPRYVDLLRPVNIQQGSARAPRRMPCPSRNQSIPHDDKRTYQMGLAQYLRQVL